jgi:hypothetical protein
MELCDASAPYKKYRGTLLVVRGNCNCCNGVNNNGGGGGDNKLDGGDNADMDNEDRSWMCVRVWGCVRVCARVGFGYGYVWYVVLSGSCGCGSGKARASASFNRSRSCAFCCGGYLAYRIGQQRSDNQRSSTSTVQRYPRWKEPRRRTAPQSSGSFLAYRTSFSATAHGHGTATRASPRSLKIVRAAGFGCCVAS